MPGLRLLRSRAGMNPLATIIIPFKTECSLQWVPWQWDPLWRGDLSPLGCEADPKPENRFLQANPVYRFYGCYAAERG